MNSKTKELVNEMHFNNIEIGTADFRLLIEEADGNGISVEPVPYHFNRLPDRDGWKKVNVAISDHSGKADMWFVDPKFFDQLPPWSRGCNSFQHPHPTISKDFQKKTIVDVITISQLFEMCDVTSVDFMKLDTEGHDYFIIKNFLGSGLPIPKKLEYESNVLTDSHKTEELIDLLSRHYKTITKGKFNTICHDPRI